MNIDELLEFDETDPRDRLAEYLVAADERLIADLARFREHVRGMTQQEVADRMGIDKSGVSRIERGGRDIQQSTLRRYAMAIDAVVRHEVHSFEAVDGASKARLYYENDGLIFNVTNSESRLVALEPEPAGARVYAAANREFVGGPIHA